jgi:hypothetical protein
MSSLRQRLKERGSPVVDAMRYWLSGDVSVPSLAEFFDRFGQEYRDHLRLLLRQETAAADTTLFLERELFVGEFGYAVPTREALNTIAALSPVLEIGAGSGAWARLLALRGADIIATDPTIGPMGHRWEQRYHPILPLAGKTAVRRWPERNVFCSWPSLNETWLRQAARAMRPGRTLIVVREEATADERTWDYVEHHFKSLDFIELPNWHFLHDHVEVWRKKTRRELAETPPDFSDNDFSDNGGTADDEEP